MIVRIAQYPLKKRLLYGVASSAAVLVAQQALTWVAHGRLTFLLISASLPLITVLFGAWSGALLLAIGVAYGALWMQPIGSFAVDQPPDRLVLLAFIVVGALLVAAGQQLAKVARRAGRAEAATQDAADRLLQVERDSRHRFDVALNSAGVPFFIVTPMLRDGRIAELRWDYLNEAAAHLFNPAAGVVVGSSTSYVRPTGWDADLLLNRLAPLAERAGREAFDVCVQAGAGEQWFHVVAASLGGSIVAWFGDITPRVRAEKALSEADRRKDEFLATLAHELRNPLAPIRQVAEILEQPGLTDERRAWCIAVLRRQSAAMALLLDDLLDVSRITRGALTLRKEVVALREVVDEAVEIARPIVEGKAHELVVKPPARPLHIDADRLRLAQVLGNLLTNAAKYTPPGGRIELAATADDEEIVLSVADNGIGIEPDKLSAIFSMFSQVKPDHHREGGLGIGLALSKSLIELHGGRLTASSGGKNRGSCFSIHLPAACRVVPAPAPTRDAPAVASAGAKRCILVVDDNVDAADALTALLELEGHEVRTVYSGEEAVDVLDHYSPEVVLLDLGLPGMSGYDVARRIRATPAIKDVTMIAITGWGQPQDRERTAEAGFDFHFTKPVDVVQLNEAIESAAAAV
ncbi:MULTISPECIES: ATP-binding protein [unclassified Caballeronia]|uniref:hybrid sensor histidine kinase/response regulator n=1 Tax=unclassified Caballeronia TaxID=2646786 RepID=UPI00285F7296|nr:MULTISPECIES: ATP-binding protein [unclassified Caballeronia]MDR5740568.1 ATP-binding protein [Caballeronia sp. LZ016]MDR5808911.1 ATP-binding protein [Caballeronia sp. LZ019]